MYRDPLETHTESILNKEKKKRIWIKVYKDMIYLEKGTQNTRDEYAEARQSKRTQTDPGR